MENAFIQYYHFLISGLFHFLLPEKFIIMNYLFIIIFKPQAAIIY